MGSPITPIRLFVSQTSSWFGQVIQRSDDCGATIVRDLPYVLSAEVQFDVEPPVTIGAVLDALESRYPMLRGTVRDPVTRERRTFLRHCACEQDFALAPLDTPLPEPVALGVGPRDTGSQGLVPRDDSRRMDQAISPGHRSESSRICVGLSSDDQDYFTFGRENRPGRRRNRAA